MVFKKAIAEDGIFVKPYVVKKREEHETLLYIWRNGWLHAEMSQGGIRYVFATYSLLKFIVGRCIFQFTLSCLLGSRYCHCLLLEVARDEEIEYNTVLGLAVDAIVRFRPRQRC